MLTTSQPADFIVGAESKGSAGFCNRTSQNSAQPEYSLADDALDRRWERLVIQKDIEFRAAFAAVIDVHRQRHLIPDAVDVAHGPATLHASGQVSAQRVDRPAAADDGGALIRRSRQRGVPDGANRETDGRSMVDLAGECGDKDGRAADGLFTQFAAADRSAQCGVRLSEEGCCR